MSLRGRSIQERLDSLKIHEPTRTRRLEDVSSCRFRTAAYTRPLCREGSRICKIHVLEHTEGRIVFLLPWNGRPCDEAVEILGGNPAVRTVERIQWSRRVDLRYDPAVTMDAMVEFITNSVT